MPRSSLSMPSTRARGVSLAIRYALDARRRSTSQTSPEIAARSPEPAKRCAVPHSFSACAAGMRWVSMMAMTSMAADSRAAGVMDSLSCLKRKKNLQREIDPHREHHKHAGEPGQRTYPDIVGGDENAGMGKARHHEHPGQHDDDEIGAAQRQRNRDQDVEQDGDFELVGETIANLRRALRPVRLPQRDILQLGLAAGHRAGALAGHPQQQEECEPDLDEDRQ